MSATSKHNDYSIDIIEKYISGDMTSTEKNAFEKKALADPFLQDAIDGYANNPSSVNFFKTNLKQKSNYRLYIIGLGLISLLIVSALFWKNSQILAESDKSLIANHAEAYSELEIIPAELETLQVLSKTEIISSATLINKYKNNLKENLSIDKSTVKKNETDYIIEIDVSEDFESYHEDDIVNVVEIVKTKYPYTYFYDLAVVDYRRYENREKSIAKTTYVFSGLGANYESSDQKEHQEFTEKIVKVSYMDYLKESVWYFSKAKYRSALKRFDVISGQYKNDLNALFYGGLANYNLNRFEFALLNFETIINLKDAPFYEEALWYLAKTEIKLGKISDAKTHLEKVILENGFYTTKAIELLKEIKK